MNWQEFFTKLKGNLLILQDSSANWLSKLRAGLAILTLIEAILPPTLPFAKHAAFETHKGKDINTLIQELEKECNEQKLSNQPFGKIGDGKLLELLIPLIAKILPLIIAVL